MRNRTSALRQRGLPHIDPLWLREAETESPILPCLLSLIREPIPPATQPATGRTIRFDEGSSELVASARATLCRWSAVHGGDRGVRVLIGGFTSRLEFDEGAMGLALRRAEAVRAYLRSRGIGQERIDIAVCGAGWFVVERTRGEADVLPSARCLLEIVDPQSAGSRN